MVKLQFGAVVNCDSSQTLIESIVSIHQTDCERFYDSLIDILITANRLRQR